MKTLLLTTMANEPLINESTAIARENCIFKIKSNHLRSNESN